MSAASAGVSAARGIGEINDLKSYVISGIGSSASEVESHLPGFAGIMQQRSVIEERDALAILENCLLSPG